MTRYWSDAAYAEFHSAAHTGVAKKAAAVPGDVDGAGLWMPDRKSLEAFQRAFAEWSGGKGGLRATDLRQFLAQLGVELSAVQARALWQEVLPDGAQRLGYEAALLAYRQLVNAPVEFRTSSGALPPGRSARDEDDRRASEEVASKAGPLEKGALKLGLPVLQAQELLLSEGLPPAEVEALLQPFADAGRVPQSVIFDYLEGESDAREQDEPLTVCPPQRKAPSVQTASAPRRPILA